MIAATVVRITPRKSPPNNAPSVVPIFASSGYHVHENNAIDRINIDVWVKNFHGKTGLKNKFSTTNWVVYKCRHCDFGFIIKSNLKINSFLKKKKKEI